MKGALFFTLALALLITCPSSAYASRIGRIDTEAAEVYKEPQNGSEASDRLPKGSLVEVSNEQVQGFYKVRLKSGHIGWMRTDTVNIDTSLTSIDGPDNNNNTLTTPLSTLPYLSDAPLKTRRGTIGARGFGGVDFLQANDVGSVLGINNFRTGFYYGGQLQYFFSRDFALLFRIENISKSIVATDSATLKTYQHDLTSTPVMMGFEVEFAHMKRLYFDFTVAAGLALSTTLVSTSLNDPAPNQTTFSDTPFTGIGALEANMPLSKDHASIFIEGGYRILRTTNVTPVNQGNGSDIYKVNGQFQSFPIDLGGFFLGVGFVVYL